MDTRVPHSETNVPSDLRAPTTSKLSNFYNGIQLRKGAIIAFLRIVALLVQDVLLVSGVWWLCDPVRQSPLSFVHNQTEILGVIPVILTFVAVMTARGLYKAGEQRRDYLGMIQATTLACALLVIVGFVYQPVVLVRRLSDPVFLLLFWLLVTTSICVGRLFAHIVIERVRGSGAVHYPVFLICSPEHQAKTLDLLGREGRYDVLEVADAASLDRANRDATFQKLRDLGIVEAFVAWDAIHRRPYIFWHFQKAGVTLHILPTDVNPLYIKQEVWMMGGVPTLKVAPPTITGINFKFKQAFDLCAASLLILLLSPILGSLALLIKLDNPGPILYKQTRVGLHGEKFKAWKFRTMVVNADKLQKELEAKNEMKDGVLFKMKDDPRVTRVGKYLRAYSLDELPQLFNVLLGEMSLVGPRPLPLRDVERFAEYHFIRHEVLPGITGLWQVSGRSNIQDFDQAIRLDMSYIQNWSIWLDLRILFQTVGVVLKKTGAY